RPARSAVTKSLWETPQSSSASRAVLMDNWVLVRSSGSVDAGVVDSNSSSASRMDDSTWTKETESSSESRRTKARVSVVRACWAAIREVVSELQGLEASSKAWDPADQVAILAMETQNIAKVISEVAVTKPRLSRRRVTRQSHHCARSRKNTAAKRPESGTHCGDVRLRCSSATREEVMENSREAAGRISSRMTAEALDMYAAETALDMRWLARALSTMPV